MIVNVASARYDVLIVGSGHGGAQVAIQLRQRGFAGTIGIVGEEADPPYERPPLSKDYLSGKKPLARILIRPPAFWGERAIHLRLGSRVLAVDPDARCVGLQDGTALGYGALVWAAGGKPRRLSCPGHELAGVHAIRDRRNVDRLVRELRDARRVVVIGAGYIGLEAAAVLHALSKPVTVVEAATRVLSRVAGEALSRFYEAEHRKRGVEFRFGTVVDRFEGDGIRVTDVCLADGERIAADLVIVGIGIVPSVEPLLRGGAAGRDGVDIDDACRTSLDDVYAVGDCAAHRSRFAGGERLRLESVQNANDQAMVAAANLMGQAASYEAVPWFWSNQDDLRLQTVGLSRHHDQAVVRGDPASRSFSLIYLKEGRVVALDCVNATRDYVQGKALVMAGATLSPHRLADGRHPLAS